VQLPQWFFAMLHTSPYQTSICLTSLFFNSPVYGGSGGTIGVTSTASTPDGWENIAIHEMGHSALGLADEYASYQGCGIDTDRDHYTSGEPSQPNVTIDSDRVSIKWVDLIMDATPMPTTSNPDCTQCDSQPSPVPTGTVGAFEGADSYHCGVYRPEFDCRMRSLSSPFCAVCQGQISNTLKAFLF
jgi:hypothetical protein